MLFESVSRGKPELSLLYPERKGNLQDDESFK